MKTFITSAFLGLFCLIFSNYGYAQCRFTRVNTTECECITLLLDENPNAITDIVDYGDGQSESVMNQSVTQHCYDSPGLKTVRRTVTTIDGITCRFTKI